MYNTFLLTKNMFIILNTICYYMFTQSYFLNTYVKSFIKVLWPTSFLQTYLYNALMFKKTNWHKYYVIIFQFFQLDLQSVLIILQTRRDILLWYPITVHMRSVHCFRYTWSWLSKFRLFKNQQYKVNWYE